MIRRFIGLLFEGLKPRTLVRQIYFKISRLVYYNLVNQDYTPKASSCDSLRSLECAVSPKAKQEDTAQSVPFYYTDSQHDGQYNDF